MAQSWGTATIAVMYLGSSDLKVINMPRELVKMPLSMWDDQMEP